MIALDPGLTAMARWDLETPDGLYVVGERVLGPRGPVPDEDLEKRLQALYPARRTRPFEIVAGVFLILVFSGPILGWLLSVWYVAWFAWGFAHQSR